MSRIFLALVSLAAIAVLGILLARNMSKPEDTDKTIARAKEIVGLANSQTDRTIAAARQLADRPQPRPPAVPPVVPTIAPPATIHVAVEPVTVTVMEQPSRSREDQFKNWLRSQGIW